MKKPNHLKTKDRKEKKTMTKAITENFDERRKKYIEMKKLRQELKERKDKKQEEINKERKRLNEAKKRKEANDLKSGSYQIVRLFRFNYFLD